MVRSLFGDVDRMWIVSGDVEDHDGDSQADGGRGGRGDMGDASSAIKILVASQVAGCLIGKGESTSNLRLLPLNDKKRCSSPG
jgi:hypothetical protein